MLSPTRAVRESIDEAKTSGIFASVRSEMVPSALGRTGRSSTRGGGSVAAGRVYVAVAGLLMEQLGTRAMASTVVVLSIAMGPM